MVICRQEKESNLALGEDLNINMPFQLCGNLSVRLSVCLSVCLQQIRQQPSLDESTGSTVSGESIPYSIIRLWGGSHSAPLIIW